MHLIKNLTLPRWREIVAESNNMAMAKKHKYPIFEYNYFSNCLEYLPTSCSEGCFCKNIYNDGVWVTRKSLTFDIFLENFVNLWAKGGRYIVSNVLEQKFVKSGRSKNAINILIEIQNNWNNWDGNGKSLPSLINEIRKTYVCDNSFEYIDIIVKRIEDLCDGDSTGVYKSKLISQLFPDIAIPFDTNSKKLMIKHGYNPYSYGNGILKEEVLEFIRSNKISMREFRGIDDAPNVYWKNKSISNTTSCSRVIDKLFYK